MYNRKRKTWLGVCFLGLFSLLLFHSCQDDSFLDVPVMKSRTAPKSDGTYELSLAESFYESHKVASTRGVGMRLSELPVCPYIPHKRGDPSWKYYTVSQNDTLLAVDVDMTDRITQDYVPLENVEAYRKTGRLDYLRSYTRYVYTLNRKTGEEQAFYMTIVPTAGFVEKHHRRIRGVTYLHRDESLSGYVLYHDLEGNFVNGWKYRGGKVVKEVLPFHLVYDNPEATPVLLLRHRCTYSVRLKVDGLTRAMDSDEGWDIDGGELPEITVTPDNGDGGGSDSGWGNLIDTPGGGTYTDGNDGNDSWDGDDNGGGSSGSFSPGEIEKPKDDNNGGYRPPQQDDGRKPVTEANFKEKVLTSDFLNKVKQALQIIAEKLNSAQMSAMIRIENRPGSGSAEYEKGTIYIKNNMFKKDWTIYDAQSIVFHEFVHYEQELKGSVPEYGEDDKPILSEYEYIYSMEDLEVDKELYEFLKKADSDINTTIGYDDCIELLETMVGKPQTEKCNEIVVRNDLEAMEKEIEIFGSLHSFGYANNLKMNMDLRKRQLSHIEEHHKKK